MVYMTVRDIPKGQKFVGEILKSDPANNAPVHMIAIVLDDLASVHEAEREQIESACLENTGC